MKTTLHLLLLVSVIFTACKKEEIAKKDEFESSYEKLQEFKESSTNTYSYVATSGSVFGYSSATIIVVANGTIISRDYKAYRLSDDHQNVLYKSWSEDAHSIGTHTEGQTALTLDEIYDKAKNEWLKVDAKTNTINFETDANGLIASCGYVPSGCQDDCFTGIKISSIQSLRGFVLN